MWCMTRTWHMTEVSQATLLLSIATQVFLISRPSSKTCETYYLLPQKFLICFPCCIGYFHYAIWNCFWSVGALEWGSVLYGFERIIFFLHIIPSRIAWEGILWYSTWWTMYFSLSSYPHILKTFSENFSVGTTRNWYMTHAFSDLFAYFFFFFFAYFYIIIYHHPVTF